MGRPVIRDTIEVVAGAGGAKGPCLIGGFRALEERNVAIGKLTGVSIGALIATLYANGFKADDMAELFLSDPLRTHIADQFNRKLSWLNPLKLATGILNLKPDFTALIKEYDLKPRRNLRLVAYNVLQRQPVVFEGTRYDLATALSASCSIPGLMRPVFYAPRTDAKQKFVSKYAAESMSHYGVLVDGGLHHMHPTEFCQGPAIVLVLGTASALPREIPTLIESYFHVLEMTAGRLIGVFQTDSCHHRDISIQVGSPDVGGVSFSSSTKKCQEMIEYGHRAAGAALDKAIIQGRIPVKTTRKVRAA